MHNGHWHGRGMIDMIHAPFSRSAQRERVFESARAFTVSQTSTHSRTECEVLRTYRASATRLSRTKRTVTEEERDRRKELQQSSNNAQIDSHGSQLCLRVPLAVRWRRKRIAKASPSVIWRRPVVSFFGHGQTNRRFDRRSGIKENRA